MMTYRRLSYERVNPGIKEKYYENGVLSTTPENVPDEHWIKLTYDGDQTYIDDQFREMNLMLEQGNELIRNIQIFDSGEPEKPQVVWTDITELEKGKLAS